MHNVRQNPRTRRAKLLDIRIDRLRILCAYPRRALLPDIPGLRVVRDTFVGRQTTTQTYKRVRQYLNEQTGTKIFLQYDPAVPWLAIVKVTFCPEDRYGLMRYELEAFLGYFKKYRILTIELSFDFKPGSGVDEEFVLRYGLFGKSRPRKVEVLHRPASHKSWSLMNSTPRLVNR
jgi:hypothetical protein